MQKNLAKGTTPSARDLVSFGNTLMRAVEAHMQSHQPRLTPQQPGKVTKLEVIKEGVGTRRQISSHAHTYTHLDAYKHAAMSAKYYYELAISQNGHFGAHYSLGLMLKLHMFLLTGVTGGYRYEEEGGKQASIDGTEDSLATFAYAHLCQSQIQYLKFLTENPTKDGGFFEHCDNIAILSDSETRNNRLFTIPISPPPQPINSTDYCDSLSGAPPETFVTKVDAVTVTGRDAIMFTNCTVLKTSHGCYTPLFAVFNPKEARSPVTVSKIPVAASVLQFAGNEYFHWITEGLARLLILQETLEPREGGYTLVLPKGHPFIIDSLTTVVNRGSKKMEPFNSIVEYDGATMRLEVDEMYYADWTYNEDYWGDKRTDHCSGAQLLPSQFGLQLVNGVLGGRPTSSVQKMVVVLRERSRGFGNEEALVKELEEVAAEKKLKMVVFRGDLSFDTTVDLFADASVVVGAHGGGLANIVFCRKGTVVVEVGLAEPEFGEYQYISEVLGFNHNVLVLDGVSMFEATWNMLNGELGRFVNSSLERRKKK